MPASDRTGYALTAPPSREGRRGRVALIDDPQFRQECIMLAAAGCSRRRVACSMRVDPKDLHSWLAKGRAQPKLEPWGPFAADYLQAEQMMGTAVELIEQRKVASLSKLPATAISISEMRWLGEWNEKRYPEQRGQSNLRVTEADPDADEWWKQQGLVGDQLRALLRDPPDVVAAAMVAEGDAIYARLIEAGWQPKGMR